MLTGKIQHRGGFSFPFSVQISKWLCSKKYLFLHERRNYFLCGSSGKESAHNVGDLSSIPGLGRFPEEGKGYPLQCSGLENSMECMVHGVAKSRTRLLDFQ